jgi:UDP-N-acetylmuramate--alanine ligase
MACTLLTPHSFAKARRTAYPPAKSGRTVTRKGMPVEFGRSSEYPFAMIDDTDLTAHPWFFCGIGGSGMLPLALILKGHGARVAGSDRSRDQGRTPEKFAWLEQLGFDLHPQDGSGVTSPDQTLVASAAVEDTVPEVVRARELGCPRMSRAQLLARLFNAAPFGIAVGGTSGKSTVTGMIGWIMTEAGRDPTIMNGAVMKNFATADAPFASARVGQGAVFVSEVDESDGSIALYRPKVAVLGNVSLDHKSLEELRELFGDFLNQAEACAINLDDVETRALAGSAAQRVTFGITSQDAHIHARDVQEGPTTLTATVVDRREGSAHPLTLRVPGRHNLYNALAAIAAASAAGVPVSQAVAALGSFAGLARRFDVVGTSPSGITVIDDFGHNPDKVSATLATLKAHPGRVIAFFQPHGYGPLRQIGAQLAEVLATRLGPDDVTVLCDPVYFGGTVDRSQGSERIAGLIREHGGNAQYIAARAECVAWIAANARPDDRIVVMGARDDTLTAFAKDILAALP